MKRNVFVCIFLIFISNYIFSDIVHTLKEGETIYGLSKKYDIAVKEIIKKNNIYDINALIVGTELFIPQIDLIDKFYTVKKGDTLYSISQKNNIPLSVFMEYNGLIRNDYISLGQILKLPKKYGTNKKEIIIPKSPEITGTSIPYWPLEGNISNYSGRIRGVQIDGKSGDFIQAVSSGKVIWYDSYKGIGKVVLIEGENGYDYLYGTKEDFNVSMGIQVLAGERLGRLKESNTSIIFSIFKNGKPLNDLSKAPR
ncbi:MAG: M23 family metallopeptidase [Spirochaetaceae bacterium]